MNRVYTLTLLFIFFSVSSAIAVDTAPRISDREIISSLAELRAGQKALEKNIDQRFEGVDQRFEAVDQRFEAVERRFTSLEKTMDQRFSSMETTMDQRFSSMETTMDQRFVAMDQRFSLIENLLLVVIAGIFGLIGYIVWDRKTAMRPLEKRLVKIENDLQRDLELQNEEGSRLTRMIKALRELAQSDEKLAAVLRSYSLL